MYSDDVNLAVETGRNKIKFLNQNPLGYFIAAMMAGVYVGLGILLIFSIGAPFAAVQHPALKLIMGVSFGIALSLVIFAGSELFTGNVMFLLFGFFKKRVTLLELSNVWIVSWLGNLAGSLSLAALAVYAHLVTKAMPLFDTVSHLKMTATPIELLGRGLACNLLVCLAIWTASRTKSDAAKLILIFWCLFAFIGSGFEHSIANMTLLAVSVISHTGTGITWLGYAYNIFWVTLGNILGGGILLAGAYHLMSRKDAAQ